MYGKNMIVLRGSSGRPLVTNADQRVCGEIYEFLSDMEEKVEVIKKWCYYVLGYFTKVGDSVVKMSSHNYRLYEENYRQRVSEPLTDFKIVKLEICAGCQKDHDMVINNKEERVD